MDVHRLGGRGRPEGVIEGSATPRQSAAASPSKVITLSKRPTARRPTLRERAPGHSPVSVKEIHFTNSVVNASRICTIAVPSAFTARTAISETAGRRYERRVPARAPPLRRPATRRRD